MTTKETNLPWQSWSPIVPNLLRWSRCDQPPIPLVAPENKRPTQYQQKEPISGWCSWYSLGKDINSKNLLTCAERIREKWRELEYFIIDDGWCRWGDWRSPDPSKFPDFPDFIHRLKDLGLKPGLWLAPFLADPSSNLVRSHPDWFIKNRNGSFQNGWLISPFSFFPGGKKYILDFSVSAAREHIYQILEHAINDWGVALLKLDFLYAPYFAPSLTDDILPHAYLTELFRYLRTNFPSTYLAASGCPYKPARYLVDSIRIGSDISNPYLNRIPFFGRLFRHHRFSLLKQNYSFLSALETDFHLDPDVYHQDLSRDFYTSFSVFFLGDLP